MEIIKNGATLLMYYLTLSFLLFLTLWRFRFREARDIFLPISFWQGAIYLIIFVLNMILCIATYLLYKRKKIDKNSFIGSLSTSLIKWGAYCEKKLMDYIASLGYPIGDIIAYTTAYYLKLSLNFLYLIEYLPRILLMFTITIDVFYLEQFFYSYYVLYLLLSTMLFRFILYISIEVDDRILDEAYQSYEHIDLEEASKRYFNNESYPINVDNYRLTAFAKVINYISVEEVLRMVLICKPEINKLLEIQAKLENPFLFKLFIRAFYTFIWGYILYFYPLPIIKILLASLWMFVIINIKFNIIMIISIIIYYFLNNNYTNNK